MKEFRIAKCIDHDGIHEYAIFSDGSRKKKIRNDEQYGKYFEVDNELNDEEDNLLRYSFRGRIKDAVDMIKSGKGDCIRSVQLFGRRDSVLYFLDRSIGEELRKKSIEGWKDTKFGWAIECGFNSSFSGYSMINEKTERISVFDKDTPIIFKSKDEANLYLKNLIDLARYYAKYLANKLVEIKDKKEREEVFNRTIDEIEGRMHSKWSVVTDLMLDMLTSDLELKSCECNLDEMGCGIVQCIVP